MLSTKPLASLTSGLLARKGMQVIRIRRLLPAHMARAPGEQFPWDQPPAGGAKSGLQLLGRGTLAASKMAACIGGGPDSSAQTRDPPPGIARIELPRAM